MKKPNITGGEWEYEFTNQVHTGLDVFIYGLGQRAIGWTYSDREHSKANAQAISAVPEMIEALMEARKELQLFLDIASDGDREVSCMSKIESALKKAGAHD